MRFKKILGLILFGILGLSLLGFALQYKTFYESQMEIRKQILLNNYDLAFENLGKAEQSWIFKIVLSGLKPRRYYLINYYRGLAGFKTGKFEEAPIYFSRAGLSKDGGLNEDSRLAAATSLWLSGKVDQNVIKAMLELYSDIITEDVGKEISWSKREAVERAFWIMSRQSSGQQARPSSITGAGAGEKKNGALKEAFKRLMEEKPLEKGR